MTMASSLGIGCGGSNGVVMERVGKLSIENRFNLPQSVVIGRQSRSRARKGRISVVATVTKTSATMDMKNIMSLEPFEKYDEGEKEGRGNVVCERLDKWMRDSVVEIVKNLREAPLLLQVYPKKKDNSSGETTSALKTEKKAVVDDWPTLKEKWETRETPMPEGVIFVEELAGDEGEEGETTTRAWGIVVQGKGIGCGPICYLLKTSRVGSGPGPGMGLCCTHFCLVRVKNFRETVNSQLKNCWLLQIQ